LTFKTDDYTSKDLKNIFIKKINDSKWNFNKNNIKDIWFEKNKEFFKYYGRDMETLFSKVKIAHSKRVFCLDDKYKKIINMQDLEEGFKKFKSNLKENNNNEIIFGMYT
jgi:hypothetical protein